MVAEHPEWAGRFNRAAPHNFLLLRRISQSLAARWAVQHLLPFSPSEDLGLSPTDLENLDLEAPSSLTGLERDLFETIWVGSHPRIQDRDLEPPKGPGYSTQTYLERDVREVLHVGEGGFLCFSLQIRSADESKSGQTVVADFLKNLSYWKRFPGDEERSAALMYGGEEV